MQAFLASQPNSMRFERPVMPRSFCSYSLRRKDCLFSSLLQSACRRSKEGLWLVLSSVDAFAGWVHALTLSHNWRQPLPAARRNDSDRFLSPELRLPLLCSGPLCWGFLLEMLIESPKARSAWVCCAMFPGVKEVAACVCWKKKERQLGLACSSHSLILV